MPTKQGYITPTQQEYIIFINQPLPSRRGINIHIYIYAKPHLVERAGNYVKWAEVGVGLFE